MLTIGMKLKSSKTNRIYEIKTISEKANKVYMSYIEDEESLESHVLESVLKCLENGYYTIVEETKTKEEMDREERGRNIKLHKDYFLKYELIVENKYPKLSKTQKKAMTYILIADSLTPEQMKNDPIYENFSLHAQKVGDNKILTEESSATLRALEKKNLIKIIHDGGKYIDTIMVIK